MGVPPPYTLEESDNLEDWTIRASNIEARAVTMPSGYERRFYRVTDSPAAD